MTTRLYFAAALVLVGCARDDPSAIGEKAQAIVAGNATVYATTFDGIPAYALSGHVACSGSGSTACGSFNVYTDGNGINTSATDPGGWFRSEGGYGYQCVELATRYSWAKFRVSGWAIGTAQEMCNTHPSSMVKTTAPVPGDLMVFGPNACASSGSGIGSAGHVAVVDSVAGNTIHTTQQNIAFNYDWQRSCASCFLHATANATNPNDPCSSASVGNGKYCGSQLTGGDHTKLYDCQSSSTASATTCACGCIVEPTGVADQCAACDMTPGPDLGEPSDPDAGAAAPPADLAPEPDPAPPGPPVGPSPVGDAHGGCAMSGHASPDGALALLLLFALVWIVTRR